MFLKRELTKLFVKSQKTMVESKRKHIKTDKQQPLAGHTQARTGQTKTILLQSSTRTNHQN